MLFVAGLALFLPYFVEQASTGWEVFKSVEQYVERDVNKASFTTILKLVEATFINGHSYELQYVGELRPEYAGAMIWLMTALMAVATILALLNLRRYDILQKSVAKFLLLALVGFAVHAVFLASIRPITPIWMIFSMSTLASVMLASILYLLPSARWASVFRIGFIFVFVAASMIVVPGYLQRDHAEMFLPADPSSGMLDVKVRPLGGQTWQVAYFPVADVDQAAHIASGYKVVHGHAAILLDEVFGGVEAQMDTTKFRMLPHLGGSDTKHGGQVAVGDHIAGFPMAAWTKLGRQPTFRTGLMGWVTPQMSVSPPEGQVVTPPKTPRRFLTRTPVAVSQFEVAFVARCGDSVAVTNMLHAYAALNSVKAYASGTYVDAIYKDNVSNFFRSPECQAGNEISWQFTIIGSKEAIDVATF